MDVHLRRRATVAAVFTAVVLPFAWLADGSGDAASTSGDDTATQVPYDSFPTPSTGAPVPVFLDNTAVIVPPAVIDVARPDGDATNRITGRAGFRDEADAVCTVRDAPPNATITVTNVDTGLSITCRNVLSGYVPAGMDFVLATTVFLAIADVAAAPVPVMVEW